MDILTQFWNSVVGIIEDSAFGTLDWRNYVMILISFVLIYLAIKKQYEPLVLLPIAVGMLLVNLCPAIALGGTTNMIPFDEYVKAHPGETIKYAITELNGIKYVNEPHSGGLLFYLYQGVKLGIYPPLIFLGIGAMTDFGPLISNPKSFILGAAAQIGIFITFIGAIILGFTTKEAGAIGIIGGADGPTAIYVTSILAPDLLGPIAVAAYSYMALVPIIQPPIMRLLTTKKERQIKMTQLRGVSKLEKILFPIIVTVIVAILLPDATTLVGMLMFGNLMKESGVVDRITNTAKNELMNIITIFLGLSVGSTATGQIFLSLRTIGIICLGLFAFCMGTSAAVEGSTPEDDARFQALHAGRRHASGGGYLSGYEQLRSS